MSLPLPKLQPGDVLLYSHKGFFDFLIREFTRSAMTHVEVVWDVSGDGKVMVQASRNGIGPNLFEFDPSVVKIRRPQVPLNIAAGKAWFMQPSVKGCGYGWWDLTKFLPQVAKRIPAPLMAKGMICSTDVDEFLKACGLDAFADNYDPGEVTPRDFDECSDLVLKTIWQA